LSDFNEAQICLKNFEKYSNIQLHKNLVTGSLVVPYGRTDRQADGEMDRHDEANSLFRYYANALKYDSSATTF